MKEIVFIFDQKIFCNYKKFAATTGATAIKVNTAAAAAAALHSAKNLSFQTAFDAVGWFIE